MSTASETAEKVANSVALTLTSRIVMILTPVMLAIFAWVGADYINTTPRSDSGPSTRTRTSKTPG
jgi:hypothetical protein